MTNEQKKQVIPFGGSIPIREIGLVTHYHYVKERLIRSLQNTILATIPSEMKQRPTDSQILNI